jgi:hypothetical protein
LLVDQAASAAAHVDVPAHRIEDEELELGAEEGGVGDAGGLEVGLGAVRERARVARVALHRGRLDDVAAQDDGRLLEERVDDGRRGVRHQDHVGLVDALPAGDRRAVEHLAVGEQALVDGMRRHGDVLLLAARVAEAEVDELRALVLDQLQYGCPTTLTRHGFFSSRCSKRLQAGAPARPSKSRKHAIGEKPCRSRFRPSSSAKPRRGRTKTGRAF